MSNAVLDFVRAKDPALQDANDDDLTLFLAEKDPGFLKDEQFAKRYELVKQKREVERGTPVADFVDKAADVLAPVIYGMSARGTVSTLARDIGAASQVAGATVEALAKVQQAGSFKAATTPLPEVEERVVVQAARAAGELAPALAGMAAGIPAPVALGGGFGAAEFARSGDVTRAMQAAGTGMAFPAAGEIGSVGGELLAGRLAARLGLGETAANMSMTAGKVVGAQSLYTALMVAGEGEHFAQLLRDDPEKAREELTKLMLVNSVFELPRLPQLAREALARDHVDAWFKSPEYRATLDELRLRQEENVPGRPEISGEPAFRVSDAAPEQASIAPLTKAAARDVGATVEVKELPAPEPVVAKPATTEPPGPEETGLPKGPFYYGSLTGETGGALRPSAFGDYGPGNYVTPNKGFAEQFATGTAFSSKPKGSGKVVEVSIPPIERPFLKDNTPLAPEEIKFWKSEGEDIRGVETRSDLIDEMSGRNFSVEDQRAIGESWSAFLDKFGYDALFDGEQLLIRKGTVSEIQRAPVAKPEVAEPAVPPVEVRAEVPAETPAPPAAPEAPLESRIPGGKSKRASIFEMEEGDLADFLNERFGEQSKGAPAPGQAGRGPAFTDYTSFRDWMDAAYKDGDLDALRTGFAMADTKQKIQFIKENKSDPLKREVISHLATGSPIPAGFKPVSPAAPRPLPGQTSTAPPPPTTPAGPPPPPPRQPTHHRKFDITALTQVFRQFGNFPTVNERLMRAYGRFVAGTKAVELKARLMWDTKLAERVLGHEIGHFIDLIVPIIGKGKSLAQRLEPLTDFRGQMFRATELRNEARNLSRDWRGSFPNGDRYRDTATELFADFMSAMFNNPEWVNQRFPKLYDAFQQLRDGKPQFASAYREIETWLQGGTMVNELRVQDRAAVERTLDILTKERKETKASLIDKIEFALTSLWNRAFEKEGKPRPIGTSIREQLETSYMWAAKRLALWHDDYLRMVQPDLNRVSSDPIEAHANLLSYSKAVRTIGERRASGAWIESHPAASRIMLERLLDLDAGLRGKFSNDLASAADADLYDLSAAIFREIHDRGEKFVGRMAREIDALDLGIDGEAALLAFNVRGKLLNPGGLTTENAAKMLDEIKADIGPVRYQALETAARNLRDLLYSVQKEMHDSGLISDKAWNELIAPNRDSYMPYAVLDYFEGKVRAGVMPQKGTARDVADVSAATQLKVAASYAWLQKQRQVQLIRDAYARMGVNVPVGETLKRSSEIDRVRNENRDDDVSRAVLWADGKPRLVEFPADAGKLFERALELPEFYQHVEWIHDAANLTHKLMQFYTQFSPRFLLYRNIIRGFRTAGLKVGYIPAARQLIGGNISKNLAMARNYAEAAFGGEMLPEVRRMVELEALPPPRIAAGAVRDLPNMRELLVQGSLPVFSAGRVRGAVAETRGPLSEKARQAKIFIDKVFTGYEAFEKIYNYQAARSRGLSEETSAALAQRGGIPRPGVAGKWVSVMEIFLPWTRVKLQGMRSSQQILLDPRFGKAYAARFAVFEALPRMAKVAIGIGLVNKAFNWVMRKDEDKNDSVMAEVMRRVSPYKIALDDIIPVAFYDPRKGEYHPFWESKSGSEVPKHWEVISWRIPSSEEGNTFGTALYAAMTGLPGVQEKLARPGEGLVENMGNWAKDYLSPGLSPIITTSTALYDMIARGKNPIDPFRGQPAANPLLFEAGGTDRAQAIAGYTLNQLGGPGELAAVLAGNFGLLDQRALDALSSRLKSDKKTWDQMLPFTSVAIAHDNFAEYRDQKSAELADKELRANAKLVMSEQAYRMYQFYYSNLKRQEKLSAEDKIRFDAAKYFVTRIFGRLTVDGQPQEGTFYGKAAAAASGSRQAKETVRRDLDAAAAISLERFNNPSSKANP